MLLAGRYAAFEAIWEGHNQNVYVTINVRDLLAARPVTELIDPRFNNNGCAIPNPSGFLLSPTGVAAWQLATCSAGFGAAPSELIQALDARTGWRGTLDAAHPGELSGLELFQCASGCKPGTTIAAWTDNGVPRIGRIG